MGKRFADTNKYKKPFVRGLQGPYKLLWDYICMDCDHAGIWIADFEIAQIYLGKDMPVDPNKAIEYFNTGEERISVLNGGSKWFIIPFISFQYGVLNPKNRVHQSVLATLSLYDLLDKIKGLVSPIGSPLLGAKDKDKDKDKEKERDCKGEKTAEFQKFCDDFVAFWNEHDALPKCLKLTKARLDKLRARFNDDGFKENYRAIIDNLAGSPFHIGENDRGWVADIDWLLRNDTNGQKMLERGSKDKWAGITRECEETEFDAVLFGKQGGKA